MTESQEVTRSEESAPLPNFLFTVALDRPDRRVARTQAELLAGSLLRQFWGGEAVVMRNFPQPLLPVARHGLEEIFIDCDLREASESQIATETSRWRFEAARLIDPSGYGWIVWAHPASLCLRNPDHLFERQADILVQPELGRARPKADDEGEQDKPARNGWLGRETISPGLVAVRAGCFREVMSAWEEEFRAPTGEGSSDLRAALQRMLWKTSLRVLPFERGGVALPFLVEKDFQEYREAAWLHFDGAPRPVQRDLALALHLQRTYGDENGLFLDILEAWPPDSPTLSLHDQPMDFGQTFPLRFLVNLGRRQDRRETALQQLALHDITVGRLPAVNSRHVRKARGYADAGRYALALTNRLGIREARRRGSEAVLSFEDDVVLHPLLREMLATIELPEDWGIFYLGGQHQSAPQAVGHRLVRCRWTADTHAFAVHRRCYDEVMRALGNPSAAGHGYSDQVLASLQARIPSYAAYPNLAWQAEDASDLAGSRYSNYHPATGRQRNHAYALEGLESRVLVASEDQADAGNNPPPAPGPAQPARLGLCFLTRGSLSHAELWNEWRKPVSDRVRLFVHSKFPDLVSDPGFRESLIGESVPTEWGNISLVRAMLALLRVGLEDPTLTHFCFVSESCVPIRPADDLLEVLTLDPRSRFRSRSSTHMLALGKRDFEPRAEGVRGIPKEMVHFHSQWVLLSRHHASLAVETDLTERFERIFAPDESYFGTLLALHGSGEDTHCSEDVTWVRWKSRRPEEYRMIDDRLAGEWKASGRFFARKVNPVCGPRLRALAQHTQSCLVNKT